MKESQSEVDENLFLLEDAESFAHHALRMAEQSTRELCLLSRNLDAALFDQAAFSDAVSRLARRDRHARVKILVKDIRLLLDRGHRLLNLSRRLSTKVEIRKLLIEAENDTEAYLLADRERVLYLHEEGIYKGFANYRAGPEAQRLLDSFAYLWERQSELSPDLRSFRL